MEYRILGPLEVAVGAQRLDLGAPRQQVVLSCLLLEANRLVTIGRLTEAIYGEDSPTTSRAQVQICISSLRRLFAAHGDPDAIATHSQGYTLRVADGQLDSQSFESLLGQARQAREGRRIEEAVEHYRNGLSLWRGPALDGQESRLVQTAVGRLNERRITANEDCVELELELGRHHELVGELSELVEEHPLRERLRGQLMLALYRSGRQAEALTVYRRARQTMIEELGIEPNESLQQLEYAILTSDESLDSPLGRQPQRREETKEPPAAPHRIVPRLLPTDIADFTGRIKLVEAIRGQLTFAAEDRQRLAVPVIAIVGKPGIGKSTIAVHVSHSVAGRYEDGQLFADLHGGESRPLGSGQVLERFLRALGVPGTAIPEGVEERAEMYRGLLAGRKMLIVLDDARSESQVLPLLPGNPEAAVLITSRSRLAGLPGAIHLDVNVFDSRQSVDLLARIAGVERVQAEQESAVALAELCGHLPLALRIAGARLAARQHWSIDQLVGRLEDETRRLDELKHGDLGIRASISLTYESVSEDARRLFRRLAILEFRHFSGWVAAGLLDIDPADAQDLLDDLADTQLIETTDGGYGVHSQYRFHDLIRVFARERLAAEEAVGDRNAALERVLGGLLFLTGEAHRREYGGDYVQVHSEAPRWPLPKRLVEKLVMAPLPWYERERLTLVAGIRQAAQAGFVELCWDLALSAVTLFESRIYFDDWRETHQIALAAARQAGDRRGQAAMLYSIGSLYIAEQRFGDARRDFEAAAELFQEAGDDLGVALVIRNIAFLDRMSGRLDEAVERYERALAIFRGTGDQVASAYVLHSMAQIRLDCEDLDEAKRLLGEALELSRIGGSRRVEAQVLHRLGETYLRSQEPSLAVEAFDSTLTTVRNIGDPTGEVYALHGLGVAQLRQGELVEAGLTLHRALELADTVGERVAEARIVLGLGELALASDQIEQAIGRFDQALGMFRKIDAPLYEVRVLVMLSEAYGLVGESEAARTVSEEALELVSTMPPAIAARIRAQLAGLLAEGPEQASEAALLLLPITEDGM
ncbi:DNA-binding transcriptional activator of the SARP family [Streptosporangium subroseum]|uniref:DNA-binding transcriptional activator of the SARP family n=1 Tax=Streptosporangium subroseum TaxID=106412 RepID=A0A239DJP6_9ACTN|nr:BTAD domain-containing putative transcriptional regulator [Streptosporangium subroseum]SNS32241.1 DNA-binding transcriptional activator of the SARP family [Streptosporangium subroseum]